MSEVVAAGRFYIPCAAGATTLLAQKTGKQGDDIDHIWIESGTGTVALVDGVTTVFTWDATTAERFVPLNWSAKTAPGWSIVTVGVAAVATGKFS